MRNSNDTLDDIVLYSYNLDLLKSSSTLFMYATFDGQLFVTAHYYLLFPVAGVTKGHQALMIFFS